MAAILPLNPKTAKELEKIIADFYVGKVQPAISPEEAVIKEEEEQAE